MAQHVTFALSMPVKIPADGGPYFFGKSCLLSPGGHGKEEDSKVFVGLQGGLVPLCRQATRRFIM
ncbi:MAG: hypothetical protein PHI06_08190 [Desulfobulbaceae bacterium]|nr:hypothetical protein [Desulfobulbaceae bacterium]